jgi:hypothetical protein
MRILHTWICDVFCQTFGRKKHPDEIQIKHALPEIFADVPVITK